MGVLSELSLRRIHAGASERDYDLFIGGVQYTSQVRSISGTFDSRSGGSGIQIETFESLEGLEDAPVELWVGYGGQTTKYFAGTLQEPGDLAGGKAAAYGPFKLMADQRMGEFVRYQGVNLNYVLLDLMDRAGYAYGLTEVIGGDGVSVEDVSYEEEVSLLEAARDVTDAARYILYDRPGSRRRAMPEPRPGSITGSKALYTESHYPLNALEITTSREQHWSKVIVMRRGTDGEEAVKAEADVAIRSRFTPPENRIMYVEDFPGTQGEAEQEAFDLAARMAFGEYSFNLSNIWLNPELEPWDGIQVERTERRPAHLSPNGKSGKYLVGYRCLLSGSIDFNIGLNEHHMSVSGTAVRVSEVRIPDPIRINLRALSSGLVTATEFPGLKPSSILKPRNSFGTTDPPYPSEASDLLVPDTDLLPGPDVIPGSGAGALYPDPGLFPGTDIDPGGSGTSLYPSETLYPSEGIVTGGLKPKSGFYAFAGGEVHLGIRHGLKPSQALKPNPDVKPRNTIHTFV